jgi:hypothetical protein
MQNQVPCVLYSFKVNTERMMKTTITINVGLDVSERAGYVFLKIAPNVVLELKNIVTL